MTNDKVGYGYTDLLREWMVYTDQVFARGSIVMERDYPDDFGNLYLPFTAKCTDNFGNLLGHFTYPDWFYARYYFFHGH